MFWDVDGYPLGIGVNRFRHSFRQVTIDYDAAAGPSVLILGFGWPAQDAPLCQVGGGSLASIDQEVPQE
jgi:hypothetical protein